MNVRDTITVDTVQLTHLPDGMHDSQYSVTIEHNRHGRDFAKDYPHHFPVRPRIELMSLLRLIERLEREGYMELSLVTNVTMCAKKMTAHGMVLDIRWHNREAYCGKVEIDLDTGSFTPLSKLED